MKLIYFRSGEGNFGDDLNGWLWPRIFPDCFDDDPAEVFVGIGSILDGRIPAEARRKVVFGAGIRSPGSAPVLDASWDVRFVRGPLSALALGLRHEAWISDGALCLKLLDWEPPAASGGLLLAPHFHTLRAHPYLLDTAIEGAEVLDPRDPPERTVERIRGASAIIAESLHAAIVADLFRVPWVRVKLHSWSTEGTEVAACKWLDWGFSMSVNVQPALTAELLRGGRRVPRPFALAHRRALRRQLLSLVRRSRRGEGLRLSADALLEQRVGQVGEAVEALRRDLSA